MSAPERGCTPHVQAPSLWPMASRSASPASSSASSSALPALIVGALITLCLRLPPRPPTPSIPDTALPRAVEPDSSDRHGQGRHRTFDRATFATARDVGVSGSSAQASPSSARAQVHASSLLPATGSRRGCDLRADLQRSRGQPWIATPCRRPRPGRRHPPNGVRPRRRSAEDDVPASRHSSPLRPPRLPPCSRTARWTRLPVGRSTASSSGAVPSRRASPAGPTVASTSRRNRSAGPPCAPSTATSSRIKDGNAHPRPLYNVGDVDGTGAKARISKYYRAYPGVHVDGIEEVALPDSDARLDQLMATKSPHRQRLEPSRSTRSTGSRTWAHRLHEVVPLPQGAA